MAEIKDLSGTDASNTARFPENQNPSTVNDGARALEGMLARALKDSVDGILITAGTGSAYTATSNRSFTASVTMYNGAEFFLRFHAACADTPTLNVSTTDARKIFWPDGTTLSASDIIANSQARVKYNTSLSAWVLMDTPVPAKGLLNSWTPNVAEVTPVSGDFALIADTSASGVIKKAQVQKIAAISRVQRQVTTKTDTSTVAVTAGTFADLTGMSVAITASANNRIVVKFSLTLGVQTGPDVAYIKLLKDSSDESSIGAAASNRVLASWAVTVTANNTVATLTGEWEDTAADTSAHTYKLQITASASENWHINKSETDTDSTAFARFASWISAEEWHV